MKMLARTQYYSMDCDSALGIYMHEANVEVHYGKGYAYCPHLILENGFGYQLQPSKGVEFGCQ